MTTMNTTPIPPTTTNNIVLSVHDCDIRNDPLMGSVWSYPQSPKASLYIPYISLKYTKSMVSSVFEEFGTIQRIDFVDNKNFVTKEVSQYSRRVYIHYSAVSHHFQEIQHAVQHFQHAEIHILSDETGDTKEYWKVYITDNAVKETQLNIHQLAHNYNIMDDKIIDMDQENFRQDALLHQMEQRLFYFEQRLQFMEKTCRILADENEYMKMRVVDGTSYSPMLQPL